MKRYISVTIVSILAGAAWAASFAAQPLAPTAAPFAAAMQGTACATPAPKADPTKLTWKKGQDEYKDFNAISATTDPTARATAAAGFITKYPDSDYKTAAMQLQLQAQAAAKQGGAAMQTASTITKQPNADRDALLNAYTVIAYYGPNVITPATPDLANQLAMVAQAGSCGTQLLSGATPAQQAQVGPVFARAQVFAAITGKDYASTITQANKDLQQDPKDALMYYWKGIAELSEATPDDVTGIFDIAKASALSPQTAAFKSYLDTVYNNYHGSADGLQDVMTAAQANNAPPSGFTIQSSVDVKNAAAMAQFEAAKAAAANALQPENSFAGIEQRLKRSDLEADEWKKVKGTGMEVDGLVTAIGAGGKSVDVAVGATDPSAPADMHLVLAAPLTAKRPKVGEKVTVDGVADSYKTAPTFLISLNQGSVKGYSPEAPKAPGGGQ